jgi:hypothetical protein
VDGRDKPGHDGRPNSSAPRHCEERSDEAIHSFFAPHDGLLRFARNDGIGCRRNTPKTLPDGQITQNLSSPLAKNISLSASGKSVVSLRASHPNEGRIAIVTNARWDAVDAEAATDERG